MARSSTKRIYFDVCALCRPLDDQSIMRNRIETEAMYLVLDHVGRGEYRMVVSPAHADEIGDLGHTEEDADVLAFLKDFGHRATYDAAAARARAETLHRLGLGVADAVHVAFAEQMADVFVTCDDALSRRCRRIGIGIPVLGPLEFAINEDLR